MNGVSLPVVARLLGHSDVAMTMRYAHVGDREIEAAAERAGEAIDAIMGGRTPDSSTLIASAVLQSLLTGPAGTVGDGAFRGIGRSMIGMLHAHR